MKFKVDENLPMEACELLRDAGHDVAHVLDEHLGGCPDFDIAGMCKLEERILVSLDTDFANIRAYPPEEYPGIIVIRTEDQAKSVLLNFVQSFVAALSHETIVHRLWIIEEHRIRIRGQE